MARDRANIRLDMWADQDWRDLPQGAQHLYLLLLSHPTLSYAGVADWKPGRLAAMTAGKTAEDVRADADILQAARFVLVDDESEEILIRSFVKHDGLMKQPRLVVSMTNAYAAVASRAIREVVAFEIQKLRDREPELKAWEVKQVETILKARGTDLEAFTQGATPPFTPDLTPGFTPNVDQAQGLRTSTATATSTEASLLTPGESKSRETKLPADWVPTKVHVDKAREKGLDVLDQAETFRLHAEAHDRRAASWNAAFTMWLKKANPAPTVRASNADAWMQPQAVSR